MTLNAHQKSAIGAGLGLAAGVATMAQSYFGSGHIPTPAEVAGLLGGAGITVTAVIGWFLAHVHITNAELGQDVKVAEAVKATVDTVPALASRVDKVEATVAAAVPAEVKPDISALASAVAAELARKAA